MIPILDLVQQYETLREAIDAAVTGVMRSGAFINGPNVRAFEGEFARYLGVPHAVGLNSGTDALHLALRALDIGPGDEVITTPFTFVATTEAIGIVGARPVFVDIDPRTMLIDPELIEAAITPRTKAILPVHLYGAAVDMEKLLAIARRHGIAVVEDCAQSAGAAIGERKLGTLGDIGCFSFFPSKNLGAYGDGGMLVTGRPEIATRVRALRGHGGRVKYHHEELGVNSRLDELQSAILRVKLPYLDEWNAARARIADRYAQQLGGLDVVTPIVPADTTHVYHQYTIRIQQRDAVQKALANAGVQTMVYYPVPLHRQAVHAALGHGEGDFPNSESAAREVLSLPIFPELGEDDQSRVSGALRDVLASLAAPA
ncbi:MAG: DegT/DnrJ/EryC1/StrS family aminotransferase [Candidatus Velthaea sp.]